MDGNKITSLAFTNNPVQKQVQVENIIDVTLQKLFYRICIILAHFDFVLISLSVWLVWTGLWGGSSVWRRSQKWSCHRPLCVHVHSSRRRLWTRFESSPQHAFNDNDNKSWWCNCHVCLLKAVCKDMIDFCVFQVVHRAGLEKTALSTVTAVTVHYVIL